MKEEREDGGERREKARERESRRDGEEGSNSIYTWRFQREAEVRREKVDGRRDSELTY